MTFEIHLLIAFLLFAVCFLLFYSTLCPTITWSHFSEVGPKLLVQIYTKPLSLSQRHFFYLATAKLFSLLTSHLPAGRQGFPLPNTNPAFPLNLLSALFASLTAVITYFIILTLSPILRLPSHLTKTFNLAWLPAAFGSLILASSFTFWSQAIVTQITSFNLLLFSLTLFFLLKTGQNFKKKNKLSLLWFLVFTLILLLNNLPSKPLVKFRTPQQFWENLETILSLILLNFRSTSLMLALVGICFGLEKKIPLFLLLSILFGQTFFDSLFFTATTPPFLLPSFLVIAIFAGLGFKVLLEIILAVFLSDLAVSFENRFFLLILRLKKAGKILRYAVFCSLGYFILMILFTSLKKSYPAVNLKKEKEAFNFGQNSLAVLPENSLVFCENEKLLYTLEYFHKVVKPEKKLELVPFTKGTEEVVENSIRKRPVFFALVGTPVSPGEITGHWEEFTLILRKPLYQVLP